MNRRKGTTTSKGPGATITARYVHHRVQNKRSSIMLIFFAKSLFCVRDPLRIKRIVWQKVGGRDYSPSFLPAHFKKAVFVLSYYIATIHFVSHCTK